MRIFSNTRFKNEITAPPSKSALHRLLFISALSENGAKIKADELCDDIKATTDCLNALGADITYGGGVIDVHPIKSVTENPVLNCRGSGTTLRFVLPLACVLCAEARILRDGSLTDRPVKELIGTLKENGAAVCEDGNAIHISKKADLFEFAVPGNVSSQYVSGLLLSLTLTGGKIKLLSEAVSRPYIDLTLSVMRKYGASVTENENIFSVAKTSFKMPETEITPPSDMSSAAVLIAAGTAGKNRLTVKGRFDYSQPDSAVIDILRSAGADIKAGENEINANPCRLKGFRADVTHCPDLFPVLCVCAAAAEGQTVLSGANRLKTKECDRLKACAGMLDTAGIKNRIANDSMIITGGNPAGGTICTYGDHRMIEAAVLLSAASSSPVKINTDGISKSWPSFFETTED